MDDDVHAGNVNEFGFGLFAGRCMDLCLNTFHPVEHSFLIVNILYPSVLQSELMHCGGIPAVFDVETRIRAIVPPLPIPKAGTVLKNSNILPP